MNERFTRQMAFFGKEGQDKLRRSRVTVIGVGGRWIAVLSAVAVIGSVITVVARLAVLTVPIAVAAWISVTPSACIVFTKRKVVNSSGARA